MLSAHSYKDCTFHNFNEAQNHWNGRQLSLLNDTVGRIEAVSENQDALFTAHRYVRTLSQQSSHNVVLEVDAERESSVSKNQSNEPGIANLRSRDKPKNPRSLHRVLSITQSPARKTSVMLSPIISKDPSIPDQFVF